MHASTVLQVQYGTHSFFPRVAHVARPRRPHRCRRPMAAAAVPQCRTSNGFADVRFMSPGCKQSRSEEESTTTTTDKNSSCSPAVSMERRRRRRRRRYKSDFVSNLPDRALSRRSSRKPPRRRPKSWLHRIDFMLRQSQVANRTGGRSGERRAAKQKRCRRRKKGRPIRGFITRLSTDNRKSWGLQQRASLERTLPREGKRRCGTGIWLSPPPHSLSSSTLHCTFTASALMLVFRGRHSLPACLGD